MTRVVLVAAALPGASRYEECILGANVAFSRANSIAELEAILKRDAHHGVVLDIATSMRASPEEKAILQKVIELFPVIRVRPSRDGQTISALYFGQAGAQTSLQTFLEQDCARTAPRTLRSTDRRACHFNVLIRGSEPFGDERTVTVDVSDTGCFLFSTQPRAPRSTIDLVILELADQTPIRSTVRWQIPWGQSMCFPGLGVHFDAIAEAQRDELRARI